MNNIDYTLWPNAGGTLGENKVQIPDGVTTTWTEGDALVGNFVYNKGHLVGFVDTKALIANESKSTTFPYDYVNIQVDKSLEGVMSFNQGERTKYFTVTYATSPNNDGGTFDYVIVDLTTTDQPTLNVVRSAYRVVDKTMYDVDGNIIGTWDTSKLEVGGVYDGENQTLDGLYDDFNGASGEQRDIILTEFNSDLSSLTSGCAMFYGCPLTTFTSDLSSLTNGEYMFDGCRNLTTFNSNLSSLTNGNYMFAYCFALESFTSDLSSLTNGDKMFAFCALTTFTGDLSSLTNGIEMFTICSNFTTFTSDLSSLTDGDGMFYGCKLNTASIKNIAETINAVTNKPAIHIGIGNTTPTEEEKELLTEIYNKGWQVFVNGSSSAYTPAVATLDETGETMSTPIPFWAKPVPSDEEHAKYTDSEGNFFNISGAQFIYVDDPETYGMFINEEDAAAQMRLTKIVND